MNIRAKAFRGIFVLVLTAVLTSACATGAAESRSAAPQLRVTPLPTGDLAFSAEAAEGGDAWSGRLATRVNRWLLGFGGQRHPDQDPARLILLEIGSRLSQQERHGVMFLEKEYRLELDSSLIDAATGEIVGRLEGVVKKRYHRFLLKDDGEELFDEWDERFLREAAEQIGRTLVP